MNGDMTRRYAITFCHTDGGTTIAVEKSRYAAESFNAELETGYRSRIGLEAWGDNKVDNKVDNNAWGDIKVDNKVDNNARGDNKVDNNVGDDTVNDTVTRPENGAEPDQNPTRTQPEPDQKCPKGAPRGDIKVDNNAKGDNKVDIKVDNNIWDDTVNRSRIGLEIRDDTENDTVNRFQTRNRTTTPYNTRTRSVQHSYKKQMYATSMDVWYNAHRTMISVEGRQ